MRKLLIILGALLVGSSLALALFLASPQAAPTLARHDSSSAPEAAASPVEKPANTPPELSLNPDPQPAPETPSTSHTFEIPSLLPMTFSPTLTPPDYTSFFRVLDSAAGYDETGPVFVVAHTTTSGRGPGNAVLRAELTPGDTITVGGITFGVTASERLSRAALQASAIWTSTDPAALFLIVCEGDGNRVIEAVRV